MNIDQIVGHYVKLRDDLKALQQQHKEAEQPLKHDMELIEAALLKHFDAQGSKSTKTEHGTAYISEVESIKITDRDAVIDTVAESGCWDVLNISVAKKNLREAGIDLPGIETSTVRKLNIRRS